MLGLINGISGTDSADGSASINATRLVVTKGNFTLVALGFLDADVQAYRDTILNKMQSLGFDVRALVLTQPSGLNCSYTITCNVANQYSATEQNNSVISVLRGITNWLGTSVFKNVNGQIESDANINNGRQISPLNVDAVARTTNPPPSEILTDATIKTGNQIADKGALGIGLKGLGTLIFGAGNEDIDIAGTKINKLVLVGGGAVALLLYLNKSSSRW